MKLRLYKVLVFDREDEPPTLWDGINEVRVLTEDGLREEFLTVCNEGGFSVEELLDYAKDPDYAKENWDDMGNLSAGTMVDMLNDLMDYGGACYFVMETDLETKD